MNGGIRTYFFFFLCLLTLFVRNYATEITTGFVGDLMLGRSVSEELVQTQNYSKLWGNLLPILQSIDFNIAHLETTFSKNVVKVPKVFNFQSDPLNVQALLAAHVKVVNLANNHILDYGAKGLK